MYMSCHVMSCTVYTGHAKTEIDSSNIHVHVYQYQGYGHCGTLYTPVQLTLYIV